MISLDFSATARCADTQRARPAKALTKWTAGFAPSRHPGDPPPVNPPHSAIALPPLPIELARDLDLADDSEYWPGGNHALKICVSARSKAKEFATVCEAGHFLDHQALAREQGFTSLDMQGPLVSVLKAIRSSSAYTD